MTARPFAQINITRDFIFKINDCNNMVMPDGPVLMSPNGVYMSIKREIIDNTPHHIKIFLLSEIKKLSSLPIITGYADAKAAGGEILEAYKSKLVEEFNSLV